MFYLFNLAFPYIVLVLVLCFGVFLPVESGMKIGFDISLLLTLAFFLNVISDKVPVSTASVPLLSKCSGVLLALSTVHCFGTILTININFHAEIVGRKSPAPYLRTIYFGILAKIVCFATNKDTRPPNASKGGSTVRHSTMKKDVVGYRLAQRILTKSEFMSDWSLENKAETTKLRNHFKAEKERRNFHRWYAIAKITNRVFSMALIICIVLTCFFAYISELIEAQNDIAELEEASTTNDI